MTLNKMSNFHWLWGRTAETQTSTEGPPKKICFTQKNESGLLEHTLCDLGYNPVRPYFQIELNGVCAGSFSIACQGQVEGQLEILSYEIDIFNLVAASLLMDLVRPLTSCVGVAKKMLLEQYIQATSTMYMVDSRPLLLVFSVTGSCERISKFRRQFESCVSYRELEKLIERISIDLCRHRQELLLQVAVHGVQRAEQ